MSAGHDSAPITGPSALLPSTAATGGAAGILHGDLTTAPSSPAISEAPASGVSTESPPRAAAVSLSIASEFDWEKNLG